MPSIEVREYPAFKNARLAAATIAERFCSIRAAFGLLSDHRFTLFLHIVHELDQRMSVASERPIPLSHNFSESTTMVVTSMETCVVVRREMSVVDLQLKGKKAIV